MSESQQESLGEYILEDLNGVSVRWTVGECEVVSGRWLCRRLFIKPSFHKIEQSERHEAELQLAVRIERLNAHGGWRRTRPMSGTKEVFQPIFSLN